MQDIDFIGLNCGNLFILFDVIANVFRELFPKSAAQGAVCNALGRLRAFCFSLKTESTTDVQAVRKCLSELWWSGCIRDGGRLAE